MGRLRPRAGPASGVCWPSGPARSARRRSRWTSICASAAREGRLVCAEPFVAVRGPQRGQLPQPLAVPDRRGSAGFGHGDDTAAILFGRRGSASSVSHPGRRGRAPTSRAAAATPEMSSCSRRWAPNSGGLGRNGVTKRTDEDAVRARSAGAIASADPRAWLFAGGSQSMAKLILLSILLVTVLVPLWAARDRNARPRHEEGPALHVHWERRLSASGHVRLPAAADRPGRARPTRSAASSTAMRRCVTASLLAIASAGATVNTLVQVPSPRSP